MTDFPDCPLSVQLIGRMVRVEVTLPDLATAIAVHDELVADARRAGTFSLTPEAEHADDGTDRPDGGTPD